VLNLDPSKLLIIAVVAVILLGPDKLPQVARQVGSAWRSFGEFRHRMESEVRSSIPDLPSSADIARLARSPSALLDHLSRIDETSVDPAGDESPLSAPATTSTPSSSPSPPVPPMPTTPTQTPPSPPPPGASPGASPGDPNLN
jgi:sec-independent protein translocase protein TatB